MSGDNVNHPAHYKAGGIEVIDVIEAFELNYCMASAVKYLLRCDRKWNALEDLQKAQWFLAREIRRREKQERMQPVETVEYGDH